jgi:hypothetical protein
LTLANNALKTIDSGKAQSKLDNVDKVMTDISSLRLEKHHPDFFVLITIFALEHESPDDDNNETAQEGEKRRKG